MTLKYDTLLFDIDDTLLDFKKSESSALKKAFKNHGYHFDSSIEGKYKALNRKLWQDFENGLIDKKSLVETRFQTLFERLGIDGDGKSFNEEYLVLLSEGHDLIDGSIEACKRLSSSCSLYLVTNGISKNQKRRIEESGLRPYFKDIFISEDIGYQKPRKEFFDYVFERIPKFKKGRALIIGDSLTSDIKGGFTSGIDTCWFNPSGEENTIGIIHPTYEIRKLTDIFHIIGMT